MPDISALMFVILVGVVFLALYKPCIWWIDKKTAEYSRERKEEKKKEQTELAKVIQLTTYDKDMKLKKINY